MIDVSEYQGTIDWHHVFGGGIRRAYVKLSQGEPRGGLRLDRYGATNVHHARAAGIKVGVYHFADAANDPEREAERFLHAAAGLWGPGDLPPALDLETMPPGSTLRHLDDWKAGWLATVDAAIGTRATFYSFRSYLAAFHFYPDRPIWGAHPSTISPAERERWAFWQHGTTHVPGIAAPVDADLVLDRGQTVAIPHPAPAGGAGAAAI